ncbi:Toxin ParE1 [Dyadobacter sp. CECT 9623]|uniref:Toxin n=1 Tax=Dyadobacter linearis TaxID=2823330 RepID=A0ABM8UKZ4_9BACT|nr:type II toxin-antitoxin system RelE/ParE family toxin [Dyadobacter sp. CECT 9623]CAG5068154.1 Toxin ParE1 [Dyadobacter sp. CECT 9623]
MIKYKLTKLAENDLWRIWQYTLHEWSVNQAEKYVEGLISSFMAIGDGKIKGNSIDLIRKGYKKTIYGKHNIFFRILATGVVEITRILHVSMDIKKNL